MGALDSFHPSSAFLKQNATFTLQATVCSAPNMCCYQADTSDWRQFASGCITPHLIVDCSPLFVAYATIWTSNNLRGCEVKQSAKKVHFLKHPLKSGYRTAAKVNIVWSTSLHWHFFCALSDQTQVRPLNCSPFTGRLSLEVQYQDQSRSWLHNEPLPQ